MYCKESQDIRDFYGKCLGSVNTLHDGRMEARDFFGRCVGTYDPKQGVTRDFYGRVVAQGNTLASLVTNAPSNKKD